jgi:hypothetical protein
MSYVFQNIDPHPSHPLASGYPPRLVRGEDTLTGWRGGSIFWKTQTQLCTLRILCGLDYDGIFIGLAMPTALAELLGINQYPQLATVFILTGHSL